MAVLWLFCGSHAIPIRGAKFLFEGFRNNVLSGVVSVKLALGFAKSINCARRSCVSLWSVWNSYRSPQLRVRFERRWKSSWKYVPTTICLKVRTASEPGSTLENRRTFLFAKSLTELNVNSPIEVKSEVRLYSGLSMSAPNFML